MCFLSVLDLFYVYPVDLDSILPHVTVVKLFGLLVSSQHHSRLLVSKSKEVYMHVLSLSLSLSLFWVFLSFSTDLEPTSQFQLQLMEDQKSQSCLGSCQSHGHEWLEVTTAKGTLAVAGRADSKRICRSALVMENLVAVFKVVQTPRRPNSFDFPWLLSARVFKSRL